MLKRERQTEQKLTDRKNDGQIKINRQKLTDIQKQTERKLTDVQKQTDKTTDRKTLTDKMDRHKLYRLTHRQKLIVYES